MATTAPNKDATKAAKLREQAKDKTLPSEVRNQMLDQANMLEEKAAKDAGVKFAKGGSVAKKMMMGGVAKKELPMRGSRTATNMAKCGSVAKKAKK
jgi:hypothetical protein